MIISIKNTRGFTLIEVMTVLAVVSVLVSVAVVVHQHALAKAQSVEGDVALEEIRRLETVYYANHGVYSTDLNAIGFTVNASYRYFKIDVQLLHGGTAYQATALPLSKAGTQIARRLTQNKDGHFTLEKVDPVALSSATGSYSPTDQGVGGSSGGTGGASQKENCRQGGEATVAQDGLLDMNFCLR